MKIALFDNAGKGAYLRQQLLAAGHTFAERIEDTDLLILDCDWPWAHPRPAMIEVAKAAGAKIALYPHGGMPTAFVYDGLAPPDERVDMRLEHGTGSIDIARLFGADLRQHAPGWLFSPTAPFAPVEKPGRVLFAPMHPNIEALQTGAEIIDPAPALNQRIYRELLDAGHDLTVSIVGPAYRNGVWHHPRAAFVENHAMSFQASYELVRAADSVVAAGTLGALAVALGKPTVMLGQGDFSDYIGGVYRRADHAGLYADAARYPLDCEDGHVSELLERACAGDESAAEWRAAFVGDDGTEAAIRLLANLVGELLPEQAKYGQSNGGAMDENVQSRDVVIGGVTAKIGAVA